MKRFEEQKTQEDGTRDKTDNHDDQAGIRFCLSVCRQTCAEHNGKMLPDGLSFRRVLKNCKKGCNPDKVYEYTLLVTAPFHSVFLSVLYEIKQCFSSLIDTVVSLVRKAETCIDFTDRNILFKQSIKQL